MCKISCTDLFNFTWVCDYHDIKPNENKATCLIHVELIKRMCSQMPTGIDDSNLTISSHETQLNPAARRWSVTFNYLSL